MEKLYELICSSDNIVFFGGAGVSTESGIPDFRSRDGLYSLNYKYPPETILSYSFFVKQPGEFFRFYRDKLIHINAKPNQAHVTLAKLEKQCKLKAIITQNIDGLHQIAGSKNVVELHGSIRRNFCMKCRKPYPLEFIMQTANIPLCECGGMVKPDIVLFEENLDEKALRDTVKYISAADMLIIGGTSLQVYPAAGLVDYYTGDKLVVINKEETYASGMADLAIHGSIGEVMGGI